MHLFSHDFLQAFFGGGTIRGTHYNKQQCYEMAVQVGCIDVKMYMV